MRYVSTRDNYAAVDASQAISLGMVPSGGLFVPEKLPNIFSPQFCGENYHQTASRILTPLLSDFTVEEITECISSAYSPDSFDTPEIVELKTLDSSQFVLELWHGPTAAFKDVALQIMPHFLKFAKKKTADRSHTLILVATSGDTGKAALEGFSDCEGISIAVFYPHGGVSEIQKLQMVTTAGGNTNVVAVNGNFDDCQNAVKSLLGDNELRQRLAGQGVSLSSANSINWGRLCPQIVYYMRAYLSLVENGVISFGEKIDFSIPTGNFGNILAGFYAMNLGLPVRRFICASNCNNVLAEFFETGIYDRNREFFRTTSPSMDILISSNLERFVFEMADNDGVKTAAMFDQLSKKGRFSVGSELLDKMRSVFEADWVDEAAVLETIGSVYKQSGYVMDTHTAVAAAAARRLKKDDTPVVIASTASPYKFSNAVLEGIGGRLTEDEFMSVQTLNEMTGVAVHRAVEGLKEKSVRHDRVVAIDGIKGVVEKIVSAM